MVTRTRELTVLNYDIRTSPGLAIGALYSKYNCFICFCSYNNFIQSGWSRLLSCYLTTSTGRIASSLARKTSKGIIQS